FRSEPAMDQEVQEYRPWNSLAVRKEVGLRNDTATLSGVLELDDAGKAMFTRQGLYVPVSFHIDRWPAQVGDSSLFYQAIDGSCQAGAVQGDLATFQLQLPAAQPMVLGKVLAIGEYTSDTDETGVELPAVAAGRTVYAVLHGIEVGETVDVVIETDEDGDFNSPTTRFT